MLRSSLRVTFIKVEVLDLQSWTFTGEHADLVANSKPGGLDLFRVFFFFQFSQHFEKACLLQSKPLNRIIGPKVISLTELNTQGVKD
jgi:hypothetical protein